MNCAICGAVLDVAVAQAIPICIQCAGEIVVLNRKECA